MSRVGQIYEDLDIRSSHFDEAGTRQPRRVRVVADAGHEVLVENVRTGRQTSIQAKFLRTSGRRQNRGFRLVEE